MVKRKLGPNSVLNDDKSDRKSRPLRHNKVPAKERLGRDEPTATVGMRQPSPIIRSNSTESSMEDAGGKILPLSASGLVGPEGRMVCQLLRPCSEENSTEEVGGKELEPLIYNLVPKGGGTHQVSLPHFTIEGKEPRLLNTNEREEIASILDISNTTVCLNPERYADIPTTTLTSRQITIINILIVISKSLSGLHLSQNQLSMRRVRPEFQAYASAITRSTLLADKLLVFRTLGPSFKAIRDSLLHPAETVFDALFLTRWVVMRLYAFGHPDLVVSLGVAKTPKDVLDARQAYTKSTGHGINSLPAYGNMRLNPQHIPSQIDKIFNTVSSLFTKICEELKAEGGVIVFERMMELIGEACIPYYSSGSIFQWLLACDLAEIDEIVIPPTARDLAKRIERIVKENKGGSGTWRGLVKDVDERDWPEATEDTLTNHLESIYNGVRQGLKTQETLFRERGFWYSDLEHCLCKVIRSDRY